MDVERQPADTEEGEIPPDKPINSKRSKTADEYYESPDARKKAILTFCEGGSREYCFAREFLNHARKEYDYDSCENHKDKEMCSNQRRLYNGRWTVYNLGQIQGILELKYIESQREGRDIGFNEATNKWIEGGWAEKYRELYNLCLLDTHNVFDSTADFQEHAIA